MKGCEIHHMTGGHKYHLWQARLREEMPQADENHGNPMLWWAKYIGPGEPDWIATGVKRKYEATDLMYEHARSQK